MTTATDFRHASNTGRPPLRATDRPRRDEAVPAVCPRCGASGWAFQDTHFAGDLLLGTVVERCPRAGSA